MNHKSIYQNSIAQPRGKVNKLDEELLRELEELDNPEKTSTERVPDVNIADNVSSEIYKAASPKSKQEVLNVIKGTIIRTTKGTGIEHISPPLYLYKALNALGLTTFERALLDEIYIYNAHQFHTEPCPYERLAYLKYTTGELDPAKEVKFTRAMKKLKSMNIISTVYVEKKLSYTTKKVKCFTFNALPDTWTNKPDEVKEICNHYIEKIKKNKQK